MQPGVMQSLHPTANTQWWYTKPGANIHEERLRQTFLPGLPEDREATKYTIYMIYRNSVCNPPRYKRSSKKGSVVAVKPEY